MNQSYIRIVCTDEAEPKYNRLQLRTDPPTFIELQPGENILSVDEFPDLKFGFRQIDNYYLQTESAPHEYNGGAIIFVDLSHFDASEVTNIDGMFERMDSLCNIHWGETRFENIVSANNTFEWMGANGAGLDVLDLTHIDFSKVTETADMLYGCSFETVDLTGCDFSQVEDASGMFENNCIQKLILDDAFLSKEVTEEIGCVENGWCSLKSISLRGCDMKLIRAIIKSVMDNRPDTWSKVSLILDMDAENRILNSVAPTDSWIAKHRREWYLTVIGGSIHNNELVEIICEKLTSNNLIDEIPCVEYHTSHSIGEDFYTWDRVYSVGLHFPSTLIRTFFDWELGVKCARCGESYSFVIGNCYAAFSNNPKMKYYALDLHQGFYAIEDALYALVDAGFDDLSKCRIIEIQHLNPSAIPNVLHHSSVWSPFTDGKFNLPEYKWAEKFKTMLSKREEKHQSYIEQCLSNLAHTKFHHAAVCTDAEGNKHLIYPSKIIIISPYQKDGKVLAKVSFEGNITLTVDLLFFTKELTGFDAVDLSEMKRKKGSGEIHVPNTDLTEVFKSIEEELE